MSILGNKEKAQVSLFSNCTEVTVDA